MQFNKQQELADQQYLDSMDYFTNCKEELGYETVWSMDVGTFILTDKIYTNVPRIISYRFITNIEMDGKATWATVTGIARDNTIASMWAACEEAYQQAKLMGDHHIYIEDLIMQDNGTLEMIAGSQVDNCVYDAIIKYSQKQGRDVYVKDF